MAKKLYKSEFDYSLDEIESHAEHCDEHGHHKTCSIIAQLLTVIRQNSDMSKAIRAVRNSGTRTSWKG